MTQTIPFPGVPCGAGEAFAGGAEDGVEVAVNDVGGGVDVAADDLGFGALAGAAAAEPTETSGVIFLIVAAETPAFDKSSMEEYGLPAIIFLAVAVPTPGKVSKSFSLALFRSTFTASACVVE